MEQKSELSKKKPVKKPSKVRNNRDSVLLHFMFIRDEIMSLPRPGKGNRNNKLDDDKVAPNVVKAKSTTSKSFNNELAKERELNDRLLDKLDAYEHAIQKIDWIALHALKTLDDVQVGGRKPKLEITEMAIAVAKRHIEHKKKLPTWKELHNEVRHDFFKNDPQLFIKKVKKSMDPEEVARNSKDPKWSYWRHVAGLISERTASSILTQLRNENKKIQQK